MVKNKDRWSALSMKERADLIKLYVSNGITSLNTIKKDYNSFGDGGNIDGERILDGTEDEQTLSGIPPREELYQDTLLPAINLEDYNRRELKRFAREVANRQEQNSIYGLTFQEVLNDNVLYNSKHSRQEERFKRLVNRQYRRNLRYTEQIARAKAAASGDIKAFQDYITTGTTSVAPYFIPLVAGPAAAAAANAGVFTALGEMLSAPAIRWPLEALGFGDFVYNNFFTDNGFKKTIKRFNEGDFWGALGSGAVDLLDLSGTVGAGYDLLKLAKPNLVNNMLKSFNRAKRKAKKYLTFKDRYKYADSLSNSLQREAFEQDLKSDNLRLQLNKLKEPTLSAKVGTATKRVSSKNMNTDVVPFRLPDGTIIDMNTATKYLGTKGFAVLYSVFDPKALKESVVAIADRGGIKMALRKDVLPLDTNVVPEYPIQAKVNPKFTEYLNKTKNTLKNSGIVGGSSVLYNKGYISGVPNDLELITTKSRKADLVNRIGFDENSAMVKPMAIESTSKVAGGKGKTEIQVIDEDFEGYATGKLAHELYRVLHPEAHATLLSNHALNSAGKNIGGASLRLPKPSGGYYTANELLDAVMASEDAITKKTLIDALSTWKTSTGYTGTKLTRPVGILHNTDPELQKDVLDAIYTMGKMNLGEDFKTVRDLYPNMDYSDIAANEQFLDYLGFDKSLASNPKAIENIVEYYHMQLSSSNRVYYGATTPEEFIKFAHPTKNWGGGSSSGAGGNSLIGSGSAFDYTQTAMSQYPVVKDGASVKSPMDILNAYKAQRPSALLSDIASSEQIKKLESLGINIDEDTRLKDIDDFLAGVNDESVTEQVGDILGIHGVFGGNYGPQSQYYGRYSKKPVASSYRIVNTTSGPQVEYEMGRLLHKYKEMVNAGSGEVVSIKEFEDFERVVVDTFNDFLSGKITKKEGFSFSKNDLDEMKRLKKELNDTISKSERLGGRGKTVFTIAQKMLPIVDRFNTIITKSAIVGGGLVGATTLAEPILSDMRSEARHKKALEWEDEYLKDQNNKDDYYVQLFKNLRSNQSDYDYDYYPNGYLHTAREEYDNNIIEYANNIKRTTRKEKRKNKRKQ